MNKQKLGKTGIEVSALALGTDLIGTRINQEQSFLLFNRYVANGGNFLDTANFYASWLPGFKGGESETTIGEWMSGRRNRHEMVISSKLGFDYPGCPGGLTAREIERECEKSLRRLRTDYIDIYQAHRDDRATPISETMEAFQKLIQAGKVRAIGASNLAIWRVAKANAVAQANGWSGYAVVEQRYTYLRPRHGADFGPQIFISEELKDFAGTDSIALIGYSVLLQGAYTRSDRALPEQFGGADSDARLELLRSVAKEANVSVNQLIIAWMRQSKPAILPIIAASREEHLLENMEAANLRLTDDQMARLDTAGNPHIARAWLQPS